MWPAEQEEIFRFEKALFAAMSNCRNDIIDSNRTYYETSIKWFSNFLDNVAQNFLQSPPGQDFYVRHLLKIPRHPDLEAMQDPESISAMHTIILEIFLCLNNGSDSIGTICNHLFEKNLVLKSDLETTLYNLVFKIISWITLIYKTEDRLPLNSKNLTLLDVSNHKARGSLRRFQCEINNETMSLHLHHLLAHFGNFMPPQFSSRREQGYSETMDDSIIIANINYHTLSTIAQIRIEWVDTINHHLEFDEKSLALKLFRYPSFCAMNSLRGMSEYTFLSKYWVSSRVTQ
jgi:hypothetical protein